MTYKELPPTELLRNLLRYDPETGKLFWLPRPVEMFSDGHARSQSHNSNAWNAKYAGREAFTSVTNYGYRQGRIFDKIYLAHRLIWKMHYDQEPVNQIDHKDGDGQNNRIDNLRDVDGATNMKNASLYSTNTTGSVGVSWDKSKSRWHSYLGAGGKRYSLGYFDDIDEAIAARKKAEIGQGFTDRHGT